MRYFLLVFVLLSVLVVSVLGFRGSMSRKPPLQFFDDMDQQLKLLPQKEADFFCRQSQFTFAHRRHSCSRRSF